MSNIIALSKPMSLADIQYSQEELLQVRDFVGGLIAMDLFCLLQYGLEESYGDVRDRMRRCGEEQARALLGPIKDALVLKDRRKALEIVLDLLAISGYGTVRMTRFDTKAVTLSLDKNAFATQYVKMMGLQKGPKDHFLEGLFKAVLEAVLGGAFEVNEQQCLCMGKKSCLFEAKSR